MKNYKSLQSYKYFTAGWVLQVNCDITMAKEKYILLHVTQQQQHKSTKQANFHVNSLPQWWQNTNKKSLPFQV